MEWGEGGNGFLHSIGFIWATGKELNKGDFSIIKALVELDSIVLRGKTFLENSITKQQIQEIRKLQEQLRNELN